MYFCVFLKRFYLFIHERQRERECVAETEAEGKAGSMQQPDVGPDSGTLGSHPEPKADAQPLSHPGIPCVFFSPHLCFFFSLLILIVI